MVRVADIMTRNLYTLREGDSLNMTRFMMEAKRIRHIPIVSSDFEFLGLITHRDLLDLSASILRKAGADNPAAALAAVPVREVMNTDVESVPPDMDLKSAASRILDHKYGCLPVVEAGKLVGIITEADFVKLILNELIHLEKRGGSATQPVNVGGVA